MNYVELYHTYMNTFRKDVCSVSLSDEFEEQGYEEEEKLGWTVQRKKY